MVDRQMLATGVLALLVAMSQVESGHAQGQGGQGQRAGAPGRSTAGSRRRSAAGPRGGGGRGGRGSAFTPAAGAKDLKSVLFNWTWHMGMLRSGNESELVKTLDYHAEGGTIQVNGQPCALTKYRVQANYQIPGYRTQIECTLPNKQTYKNVETMSGDYAWDEDIPGAELVPGKGKATPRPETLEERRIRLWASPHGAPKAAIAGAAGLPPSESFGQNPATLLDRQAAAGAKATTTLSWQGDKAVVTYPIPGVPGATATATLNQLPAGARCREERDEHDGVRLRQFPGLEQPPVQDRGSVRRHDRRASERHSRSRSEEEGDRDRPGLRRRAGSRERAEGR